MIVKPSNLKIIDDGSYRAVQVREVAKYLPEDLPRQLTLTIGLEKIDEALAAKGDGVLVSIGDPGREREKFDLIFCPKHDPHPKLPNIKTTTGIINHITPEFLRNGREGYTPLRKPIIAVLLGGRHVGGSFYPQDASKLANILNKSEHSVLITTSKRTEEKAIATLKKELRCNYKIFDYNKDGLAANPYYQWLAWADKVIVTADSVRMCSEACSSGKQVFIMSPEKLHFSYAALRDSLIKTGAAHDVGNLQTGKATLVLNEAKRVAQEIIKYLT